MDNSESTRRFAVALAISAALHLFPIFSSAFHLSAPQPGTQIVLQATIMPNRGSIAPATPPRARAARPRPATQVNSAPPPRPAESPPSQPVPEARIDLVAPDQPVRTAPEPQPAARTEPVAEVPKAAPEPAAPPSAPDLPQSSEDRGTTLVQAPGTPTYPPEARARGLESCVLAAVDVSASGEVQGVRILHADVPGVFDQAVIDAHTPARYLPARERGESRPSRVLAVVSFVLRPGTVRNCAFKYATAARKINALAPSAQIGPALVEEALRASP